MEQQQSSTNETSVPVEFQHHAFKRSTQSLLLISEDESDDDDVDHLHSFTDASSNLPKGLVYHHHVHSTHLRGMILSTSAAYCIPMQKNKSFPPYGGRSTTVKQPNQPYHNHSLSSSPQSIGLHHNHHPQYPHMIQKGGCGVITTLTTTTTATTSSLGSLDVAHVPLQQQLSNSRKSILRGSTPQQNRPVTRSKKNVHWRMPLVHNNSSPQRGAMSLLPLLSPSSPMMPSSLDAMSTCLPPPQPQRQTTAEYTSNSSSATTTLDVHVTVGTSMMPPQPRPPQEKPAATATEKKP